MKNKIFGLMTVILATAALSTAGAFANESHSHHTSKMMKDKKTLAKKTRMDRKETTTGTVNTTDPVTDTMSETTTKDAKDKKLAE